MNLIDNNDAYETISWILDNADMGFFIVTASSSMQKKVADLYKSPRIEVYDYADNAAPYSSSTLSAWAKSHGKADALFILNMQIAFVSDYELYSFNMSRNTLADQQRIWVFFMTEELEERLSLFAFDIYSFMRLKAHFFDEELDLFKQTPIIIRNDQDINVTRLRESLKRYKDLEEELMQLPLKDTPQNKLLSTAITLSSIAKTHAGCIDYENALRLLFKVLLIREQCLGTNHPVTAGTYNEIANVYLDIGDYEASLMWYRKTLEIIERTMGTEHSATASIYNDMANLYYNQGDYSSALLFDQKALAIREKTLGTEHFSTASTYNNIAGDYQAQGDYPKALDFLQKATYKKMLDTNHTSAAKSFNNIGVTYQSMGYSNKALSWYERALEVYEKAFGCEHLSTAIICFNIAGVYNNQSDYKKALVWHQKALAIYEKILGTDHSTTIMSHSIIENIGQRYRDLGSSLK